MIKVKNIALELVCKKYKKESIKDFTDLELKQACLELGVTPKAAQIVKNGVKTTSFQRLLTEQALIKDMTFSDYVSAEYWSDETMALMDEIGMQKQISEDVNGLDTLERFAEHNLGFFKLRPGASQELNANMDWIDSYLKEKPYAQYLEITDEDGTVYRVNRKIIKTVKSEHDSRGNLVSSEIITVEQTLKPVK